MSYINRKPFFSYEKQQQWMENKHPIRDALGGLLGFAIMCLTWFLMFFALSTAIH